MSYGWLTESALQPKPGKPVQVSSESLQSLRRLVSEGEDKLQKKRGAGSGGTLLSRPTRKVGRKDRFLLHIGFICSFRHSLCRVERA